MNPRVNIQQLVPLFVVLLFAAVVLLVSVIDKGTPVSVVPHLPAKAVEQTSAVAFDAVEAADPSTARWQAMARFYEKHGMLTRDPFDYEQAEANHVARWQAMAKFYEDRGMLTRYAFDYEQAAALSVYRWEAMARFYEVNGMLNDEMSFDELSAYRWNAMARAYERMGMLNK